jgi:hypothetical protein
MNRVRELVACLASIVLAGFSHSATGAPPSFRISEVFSDINGSLQFIRLTETEGLNGQQHFAGLTLTSTHGGVTKTYTFASDLSSEQTANLSIVVAASRGLPVVVGGTSYNDGRGYNCCYRPHFATLPARFIATDGGTLDFAGVHRFTYSSLPTDGLNALYGDGTIRRATVPGNGACYMGVGCRSEFEISLTYEFAFEYYNAELDHYFLSASAPDIDALESGRSPGWQWTGQSFFVAGTPNGYPGLAEPVCRFYLPPGHGNSHFFSASKAECADVRIEFPDYVQETDAAFYVALPDPATGECPPDGDFNGGGRLSPLYRLWNQRLGDSNHRYTTSRIVVDEMIAKGYRPEGYGPLGVVMCVP